jgi:hypothetical protein
MKKHEKTGLKLLLALFMTFMAVSMAKASSTAWDASRQIMLVRGIGIMNSGDPSTYYLVLGKPDTSQGTLIMEVLEVGKDNISDEAVFYPEEASLNFMVDLPDGNTYDIWMKIIQGKSGRFFAVLTSFDYYPTTGTMPSGSGNASGNTTGQAGGYTTSDLQGCYSPDNSGWLSYYCFDGAGNWYLEDWNAISGCTGALKQGRYQVQGNTLQMCDDSGCETHTVQANGNGIIVDGDPYSASDGCN